MEPVLHARNEISNWKMWILCKKLRYYVVFHSDENSGKPCFLFFFFLLTSASADSYMDKIKLKTASVHKLTRILLEL